ncbi:aspartate:alanine exchanger family transporter [Actinomarinicola tropica]|uniref:aspartate:alanine exchanger family transporter n=1 Tax=Actinomarinicola tropica TaxID=2789776 RepID=UPI00189AD766|nr:TrkA C-terminal domain-containing protein [Actinomarinicola tropica]
MVDLLADNPVLLLALVVGAGGLLGALRVAGFSLGPAAALFVGLAASAYDERLVVPPVVLTIGLVFFTYLVGLDAGPSLRVAADRRSLAAGAVVAVVVTTAAGAAWAGGELLDLAPGGRAGLFAGATTNTPALAAATEQLRPGDPSATVGYSLTYPLGVVVMLVAAQLTLRRHRPDAGPGAVVAWTLRVDRDEVPSLGELRERIPGVAFGRVRIGGRIHIGSDDVRPRRGDLVVAIGHDEQLRALVLALGPRADIHLPLDRRTLDYRRIAVSDRRATGRSIGSLDLVGRFGAVITRVRRGDADLVADPALVLRPGDRVRVVASRDRLDEVAAFLGDSERGLAEVDGATLGIGIGLGLLVGEIPLPLPGGDLRLGAAGGPLVVGLLLGALGRTGRVTWTLPYGVGAVLRQFGALLFFATVGTTSGAAFADEVASLSGVEVVALGAATTVVVAAGGWLAARVAGMAPPGAAGLLAGLQTQPAVLAFADDRTRGDDRVNLGYAMVFPVAMIAKILAAQLLAG